MKRLGLNFGVLDFVVDHDNNIHFLEVNTSGNFLFLEEACPDLPLLDTMCQFLSFQDKSEMFVINNEKPKLKLAEMKSTVDKFITYEKFKYNEIRQNLAHKSGN